MLERTNAWLELDSDPASRAAVEGQLAAQDWAALRSAMCSRLEFGTAGLRAVMAPGFARMNAVTVQQATQGLAVYLQEQAPAALAEGGVVIGYDARHNSAAFALLAARVVQSRVPGVRVALFAAPVPTPLVAAGVAQLGAAAGVMVTASHNQKQYNGYKVRRNH